METSLQLNLHSFSLFHSSKKHQNLLSSSHKNPSSISLKILTFNGSSSATATQVSRRVSATRIAPSIKTEAQCALMDYLHSTQGYPFIDAEFISNNSPHFIQSLLSKIKDKHDVSRSLMKFLRYNPVNEFEPFLESLGISQSELKLLLPSDMIFLSDDPILLDNFHALFNLGVPRNRMGKIYKEAREIFGYASGVLSSKFQAYENLGLSKSLVIKLVVCCPRLLVGDVDSEFVVVLDWLRKIGIENEWIVNYMSCSRSYSWKKMLDTIQFLHMVGYSEEHMHNLFKEDPKLLFEGFGKKLFLVLARVVKLGVKVNVICSCFVEHPHVMSNKCAENLLSVIAFLYSLGIGQDDIAHILSSYMHILSKHSIKGRKTVCKELGVGKADLCEIIKDDPLKLISLASRPDQKSVEDVFGFHGDPHNNYLEKTIFLQKLGYSENTEEMEKAFKVFRGRGDQLQERFDCLVEAGLDYNTVIEMIKRVPMILNQKKSLIQKKIDFVKDILGYPIECLVGYPTYFCHDLDKIIARCSMYEWLKEMNAVNPELTLSTVVSANNKRFVKNFVNMHPQGPTIWNSLKRSSNKEVLD